MICTSSSKWTRFFRNIALTMFQLMYATIRLVWQTDSPIIFNKSHDTEDKKVHWRGMHIFSLVGEECQYQKYFSFPIPILLKVLAHLWCLANGYFKGFLMVDMLRDWWALLTWCVFQFWLLPLLLFFRRISNSAFVHHSFTKISSF